MINSVKSSLVNQFQISAFYSFTSLDEKSISFLLSQLALEAEASKSIKPNSSIRILAKGTMPCLSETLNKAIGAMRELKDGLFESQLTKN